MGVSSIYTNIALNGCIEELKRSPSVEVSASDKDKSRKDASDYAKASKDTYVVLIQLDQEVDNGSANVLVTGGNPRTLVVNYVVFTPGTGKVKTSGRAYQGTNGGPRLPNSQAAAEYELRRCGHDVADRVLASLDMARPPRR